MRPLVCHPKFTNMILVMMCLLSLHLVAVSAQACEFPPYYDNGGYYTYAWSWDPGHDVQVYVDNNYQDPDRNQIVQGIFNWNSWRFLDCSYINFVGGQSKQFTNDDYTNLDAVPDFTVYW